MTTIALGSWRLLPASSQRAAVTALVLAAFVLIVPAAPVRAASEPPAAAAGGGGQMQLHSDPLEKVNRPIFRFNDAVDRWFFEPLAKGYDFVMPNRAQTWVDNFFTNLRFPIVFANCLLQGKIDEGAISLGRFVVNSTIGIGGFGDPATHFAIPAPNEDFGQTLGKWGLKPGAYLVLPLLGPSNLRDGAGMGVDAATTVWPFFVPMWVSMTVTAEQALNTRSLYIEEIDNARTRSLDYYAAVRDAYLQRRQALVDDHVGAGADTTPSPSDEELYFPDTDQD